ncbi:MAG: hypothetical protein H0U76_20095 [Ktedonobacteraceae bacterium]|nr:hypothetical protein [Ktedonobacteraceae bacterium]
MLRTWETDEVIRHLIEGDQDEIGEVIDEAGDAAPEALRQWVRQGNAPKSLYDAVMRFTRNPDRSFDAVDWEEVTDEILRVQIFGEHHLM